MVICCNIHNVYVFKGQIYRGKSRQRQHRFPTWTKRHLKKKCEHVICKLLPCDSWNLQYSISKTLQLHSNFTCEHPCPYTVKKKHTQKKKNSAKRVTNTPGRQHYFLIIKHFKVNDNDIRQDIVYNVSFWVTLIYHPKYNFPRVNSLQDMKQICWAIKYKSVTYIYLRS